MQIRLLFSVSLLLTLPTTLLRAEESPLPEALRFEPVDPTRERTVPIKVYLPANSTPHPVIIFSHGLGGSRENSAYLGEFWAKRGYVAVFVQHAGSDEDVWKSAERGGRMEALKGAISISNAVARYGDIPFVIDRLEEWNKADGNQLKGKLDLEHIGLCGHSFGAVTTQALMGQRFIVNRSFHDPRIDAFFAMSPSASRGIDSEKAFGHITAPVLCMTGTEDDSPVQPEVTPESRREVYAALPAGDKYQLVFEGAGHFAFSDTGIYDEQRKDHHHPAIQEISTRFWDAYLKGDATAKTWLKSEKPQSDLKLLEKDLWEWK